MVKDNIPWVEKYRPRSIKEMVGFENVIAGLKDFLDQFFELQNKYKEIKAKIKKTSLEQADRKLKMQYKSIQSKMSSKTAAMLIGPPGIGKTTIVYALAHDYDLSVIEMNASDVRTEDAINEKLKETVKNTNLLSFTKKTIKGKLILIDEVDGIHARKDKGGLAALKKIISYSRFPVIMTCNFKDYRKFGDLYKLSSPLLDIRPAKVEDVAKILRKIAQKESIEIQDQIIKKIAEKSRGDFRSAINDLQALCQGSKSLDMDAMNELNFRRDQDADIHEVLQEFFHQKTIKDAKRTLDEIENKDINFNSIGQWFDENILDYITKKQDVFYLYQNFAFADKILGYIGRSQDYGHLSYFYDILAGGIRFAKSDSKIPDKKVKSPRWFRMRATPNDEIALRLEEMYRISLNNIMREIRPVLPLLIQKNTQVRDFFAHEMQIEPKNVLKTIKI